MTVTVRHANDNDRAIWDAYVGGHRMRHSFTNMIGVMLLKKVLGIAVFT